MNTQFLLSNFIRFILTFELMLTPNIFHALARFAYLLKRTTNDSNSSSIGIIIIDEIHGNDMEIKRRAYSNSNNNNYVNINTCKLSGLTHPTNNFKINSVVISMDLHWNINELTEQMQRIRETKKEIDCGRQKQSARLNKMLSKNYKDICRT